MSEELEILKDVAVKLDAVGIPYVVSGSVAMNFCATPRMTRDTPVNFVVRDAEDRFECFSCPFGKETDHPEWPMRFAIRSLAGACST